RPGACPQPKGPAVSTEARQWIEWVALWAPLKSAFLFIWGAGDPIWLLVAKRLFLLLPLGAIALSYWTNVLSLPTLIVRPRRRMFVSLMLVTWWDLARAMFAFWGGVFRFALRLLVTVLGAAQMLALGLWTIIQELLLIPIRFVRSLGSNALAPGVPWI